MNCTSATQGTCEDGVCACKEGWTGVTCNVKLCKNNCVDQGFCVDGKCKCFGPVAARRRKLWRYGFEGDDCSQRRCPANCTSAERGSCNGTTGLCQCVDGAVGIDCNRTKCDKPCNGKGVCPDKESGCQCDWGWKGDDCQTPYCVNNCSFILGQGYCVKATQTCQCQAKFTGHDCSQRTCKGVLCYCMLLLPLDGLSSNLTFHPVIGVIQCAAPPACRPHQTCGSSLCPSPATPPSMVRTLTLIRWRALAMAGASRASVLVSLAGRERLAS